MKKKLIASLISFCSIFLMAGFAACDATGIQLGSFNDGDMTGYTVDLDLSKFSPVIAVNSEFSYESIQFNCSKIYYVTYVDGEEVKMGHEFVMDIRQDMIVSGGETDTVGEKELVIAYAGQEFIVPYAVKYKIDFAENGEIFNTQYVMSAEEIVIPDSNKEGFSFANDWSKEIPEELTDNLVLETRYYDDSRIAPTLESFEKVYEPNIKLGDFPLPSNENGEWVYVEDVETELNDVGEYVFAVEFIPVDEMVAPKSTEITIAILPIQVDFTVGEEKFVYDGQSYFPTYQTSKDVEVEVLGEAQTEAGVYTYALLVTEPHHEGFYSGSFEIVKPEVTITTYGASMKYGDEIPELNYTIEGFENEALLGVQILTPSVTSVGDYEVDVAVANPNVNVNLIKGTLRVEKGDLIISDPTLSTEETPAVYESPISSVTLTGDYRGVWTWKEPTAMIDSVESFTATAVFTPNNANYNLIEREITITNLDRRTLEITVLSCEYVYTGSEYTIVYEVEDGKNVTVEGVVSATNAGSYETELTIDETYYKGSKKVTLFIDKATPVTDFSTVYTETWNAYLILSDISLPEKYTWDAPETQLYGAVGTKEYAATYTPDDTANYYKISGAFTVTVEKAQGVLHGVKNGYAFTYQKDAAQTLSGITSTPSDGTITYTYVLNGEKVDELKAAGTYDVTVDLLESAYYTAAQVKTQVVIDKVVNTDVVTLEQSAIYGAKMSSLALPTNEFGVWTWANVAEDSTVGNVGKHTYTAIYTPNDLANYETRSVNVSVTVIKQTVYEPTVPTEKVYTGGEISVFVAPEDALYKAEGALTATNVGEYKITLTLKDSANFKWSGTEDATIERSYAITQADNEITSLSITGWTYNQAPNAPKSTANFGVKTVVYYYAPVGTQTYTTEVPTKAGVYNLKAVIAETANYAGAEKVVTAALTIAKATPVVVFDGQYEEIWYNGLTLSSIDLEEGFAWKEDLPLEVGTAQEFAVIYTPEDTVNYVTVEGVFTVTVTRRTVTLSGVQDSYTHTYDGLGFEISGVTASPNVELVYTYSSGNLPVDVNEYTVTITVKDTAHYTFGTEPDCVVRTITIEKAYVETDATYTATYLETLGTLELPTSEYGVWSWKQGDDTLVGSVGERKHTAVFTSTSANHESFERDFIVNVTKKEIPKPTLTQTSFVYTGEEVELLGNTDLYTVKGNKQTDVGEYTIVVTLTDENNFAWLAGSVDPTFFITQATTEIKNLAIEGWTYGEDGNEPTAETNFGTIEYWYAGEDGVFSKNEPVNAGNYLVKARVEETKNYTSYETQTVSFVISKADYTKALLTKTYTIDWFDGITLAAINTLPEGYTWTNTAQTLTAGVTETYGVTYVDPTGNYNPAYGEFTVTVNKIAAAIDVETVFGGIATEETTVVYTGGAFVVTASKSHTEAELIYTVNGVEMETVSFTNAGTYEIGITLAETAHYLAASWTKTIVIEKATATYTLPTWAPGVDATMADLSFPIVQESIEGGYEWIWRDIDGNAVALTQKVGEPAETVEYQLYFASNDENYKSFTVKVTMTVGKTMWAIGLEKTTFTYTGDAFSITVVGVSEEINYTIEYLTDFENVGSHTVEITMAAADYETNAWMGSATETICFNVTITPAVNTVKKVEIEGWTFGKEGEFVVETKFGGEITYSHYDISTPNDVEEGVPENAGTYVLIATSAGTENYTSHTKESAPFTIAQAKPTVTFTTTYTLDWFDGITLKDVALDSNECAWKNGETSLEVGQNQTFTAVYTPKDKNFYAIDVEICVNVDKADAFINGVEESYTHTYSTQGYSFSGITASHDESTLVFAYTLNGKPVTEIKGVGEYNVTITLAATTHYETATATTTVTVEQADNKWTGTPSISKASWVYDTEAGAASAQAAFGEVIKEYKLQTESEYTLEEPKDAGSYHVRFRVVGTSDYKGLTSDAIPFVIEQATVTASLADDSKNFVYNDEEYTANVVLSVEDVDYEVTDNKQTAAGSYNLCVTLKDANYKFANGTNQTTVSFTVAKTVVTLGEWTITNGKYGETAPQATIARTDGGTFTVQIKYYYDTKYNGEYANELSALTKNSNAGTYYVKAVVEAGGNNYDGATTEPVSITIAQADTNASLVTNVYETEWQSGLKLSSLTPTGTGAGAYVWVVEKGTAEETLLEAKTYTNFKIKFTPTDKNYAPVTVTVTVTIDALDVTVPTTATLTDGVNTVVGNPTYNGKAWTNKITETEDYTISATSATNAGDTVVVTFTLKENREWVGGETSAKQLTFTVQKARNEISGFAFDSNTDAITLSATYYTEKIVTYYYKVDGEYVTTLPNKVGTYDVKVVIAESENYLSVEREFTQAVTLLFVSLEPMLTQSGTNYTGAVITVTVSIPRAVAFTITSTDEGVTVNGNTVTVTNAKTYTLTLTLAEDTIGRYKWNDQEEGVASTTRTFTVNASENGWADGISAADLLDSTHVYAGDVFNRTYNGQASIVDLSKKEAWTKFGSPTITYYSVNAGVETPIANGVYPTNAGNYKIKITVESTSNYSAFTKEVSLVIAKLNTVLSAPTYNAQLEKTAQAAQASGYNYATAPAATAEGTGQVIAGTFTYGALQFNSANSAESTYTLTFTPTDSTNVNGATIEVKINLIGVAYTGSDTSKTYYPSIEKALSSVTSGIIWIVPNANGASVNYDVVIENNVEIKSGVTLILPYGAEVRNENGEAYASDATLGDEATIDERVTYVRVAAGVKVTVNGTLEVAGRLNGGGSGKFFSGQTKGNYAELALEDGATIHVYNELILTGFITGAKGHVITDTGSTIRMPFVYCDHHGGTFLTQMNGNKERVSPFNRYQFRNIRNAMLTMKYGSTLRGFVNLQYTLLSASIGHSEATVIGQDDGVIELLTEYSYLTAMFDPATSKNDLKIYGNAKTNFLILKLQLSILPATVSTEDYDFVIPSYYRISLYKVEGNTDANNGQFTMSGVFKLLPGAQLTVGKGATLTAETLMVYTDFKYNVAPYAVSVYEPELSNVPAILTVNGTMIVQNLGGIVNTNEAGAKISVVTSAKVSLYDLSSYDYNNKKVTFMLREKTLALPMADNENAYHTALGTYYSNGEGWYPANVTVTFSSTGSTFATAGGNADANGNGYILQASDIPTEIPTRTHYTFRHWCLTKGCTDETCEGVKPGDKLYAHTTIYAAWTADEYTIKFMNAYDGTTAQSSIQDITFTLETPLIALNTPNVPKEGYNFSGWFTAAVDGTAIDSIVVSDYAALALANGGSVTIYAYWTNESVYTVLYQVASSAKGNGISVQESAPVKEYTIGSFAPISQTVSGMSFADIKEDTSKVVYFDGWYIDASYTTKWSGWQDSLLVGDTVTLYGRWIDKYQATFNTDTNLGNATTVSINTIYLYAGQSYDASVMLADKIATLTANNTNTEVTRYFAGWTVSSGTVTGNAFTLTADSTVTVVWGNKVSITAGTMSNASVSIDGVTVSGTTYHMPGDITFAVSYTQSEDKKLTISGCNCGSSHDIQDATSHTHTFEEGASITVGASSSSSCIVAGTLLTLIDGTQKKVEDVTAQDQVLIFNHETGAYEAGFVLFTSHKDEVERLQRVINLQFSDGTVLRIVGEHAAFDLGLNRYVYLAEHNVNEYIGHNFYTTSYVEGQFVGGSVTLTGAMITEEVVKVYCPVTAYHMNCFAEGLLTMPNMPNNIHGMINIFEFGENLKYDEEKMQADIERYGVFTYDDFVQYISYEAYMASPAKWLKVAIGKGMLTDADILLILDYLLSGGLIS